MKARATSGSAARARCGADEREWCDTKSINRNTSWAVHVCVHIRRIRIPSVLTSLLYIQSKFFIIYINFKIRNNIILPCPNCRFKTGFSLYIVSCQGRSVLKSSIYISIERVGRQTEPGFALRAQDRFLLAFCVASLSLVQLTSRSRFASLMISLRRSFSRFRSLILLRMCLRSGFEMCNEQ